MSLATAFQKAWTDFKLGATAVASFLTKNQANIQAGVTDVSTVVSTLVPGVAPIVTAADSIEEVIVGKILALANDAANATTLSALFQEVWPTILSLKTSLSSHSAVVAATAPAVSTPAAPTS